MSDSVVRDLRVWNSWYVLNSFFVSPLRISRLVALTAISKECITFAAGSRVFANSGNIPYKKYFLLMVFSQQAAPMKRKALTLTSLRRR